METFRENPGHSSAPATSRTESDDDPSAREPQGRRKPLRYRIGIGLLILYPLLYLVAAVVPFLPFGVAAKASAVAAIIGGAEVILVLGIACVGKETYQAIKARFTRRGAREAKKAKKASSPASPARRADASDSETSETV